MISAPFVPRVEPVESGANDPPNRELERLSDAEYAQQRLSGTVWSRGPAPAVYRSVLAFGRRLGAIGVSADGLTVLSLVLAGLAAVAASYGWFVGAALLVLASGACDALDGIVARSSGRASRFGALLDSTVDRLADGLPLVGVVVFYSGQGAIVAVPVVAMMGAFTVSYIRARAEALGGSLPPLFMRRAERVALLVLTFFASAVDIGSFAFGIAAPLVLLGTAMIGLLSYVGAWSALRSARHCLEEAPSSVAVGVSEPNE